MMRTDVLKASTHYHIRWPGSAALDPERFETRAEAEAEARQLAYPGESYTIEERDDTCAWCVRASPLPFSDNESALYAT
jgi:hypothetical protein